MNALTVDPGSLSILAVGDITGDFFVPAYQRGYRWGKDEVERLLDDIHESNGTTYYLQPLVVKRRDANSWELVDGQQRLTTLLLIFRYLQRTHLPTATASYSITYETRPESKKYLDELSPAEANRNIDFFHMSHAYQCIEQWFTKFTHRTTHEATRLHSFLFTSVKVLWYEAPEQVDSTDLFTRLNVGRIPLTDAELVKALLLRHGQIDRGHTDRTPEIATRWDTIERDLQRQEVWAFVTGRADLKATRIGLLLDTLAGGASNRTRPLFTTFETVRKRVAEIGPKRFWDEVVALHSLVLGWYENRDLFHKIGYLIAVERKTFAELIALSNGKEKSAFQEALDEEIRSHLHLTSDELGGLTYKDNKTADVLLLMNVETIRRKQGSSERYSFHAQSANRWSIEHIHAQNAEDLKTEEQWRAWLSYHAEALKRLDFDKNRELIRQIDHTLAAKVITRQTFRLLATQVIVALPHDSSGREDIDSITNLALLDRDANAALGNSVFEVKRQDILNKDKLGSYIPICTLNVFLKYYTEKATEQLHFWSTADRNDYLDAMKERLKDYLIPDKKDTQ